MSINKILICDDEENIRESLKLNLSHTPDLIIFDADRGEKALKILSEHSDINLVLMDLDLPDIKGLDLAAVITKRYPIVKIIIVTGYEDAEMKTKAFNVGVSGYITKPFVLIEFLKVIDKALINVR